ncbi:MAG: carboxypeptidase-like regulatory domain-containing protein [Chitinophagaceae bacterium]|nr:carboxypeptidase-like regulatory domain-containing protein [Chitinophagaceae bacterium]
MKKLLLVFFIFASIRSSAQKIFGTVFSDKGDLLPYASVTIKGTSVGTSANNKAKFSFAVGPGTYTVVCQHIGYKTQEKNITVTNEDAEITFIIAAQQLDMTEVVVKSGEDPAYEIIRQAIKKRSFL